MPIGVRETPIPSIADNGAQAPEADTTECASFPDAACSEWPLLASVMSGGYNKLWRKWCQSPMARDANATLVFLHLLCNVRWEPKVDRRYGYTVERGEWDVTHKQLSAMTGLTPKAIRGAIDRLVKYGTVEKRQTAGHTTGILRLCNYAEYQAPDVPEGRKKGQTKGRPRADQGRSLHTVPYTVQNVTDISPAPDPFEQWWQFYPKKSDKKAAKQVWDRLTSDDRSKALDSVQRFAAVWAGAPTKELCKTPAVWLNKGAWEFDEADERRKTAGKGGGMFQQPKRTDLGPQSSFDSDERQRAIREHEERQTQEVK